MLRISRINLTLNLGKAWGIIENQIFDLKHNDKMYHNSLK